MHEQAPCDITAHRAAVQAQGRHDGEITLRGRILAVGGIREKLLAAARAGVELVCIPQAGVRELAELPASLKRKLEIVTISTLDDFFACVLLGGAPLDGAKARVAIATAG